jgi:hypothetical protein
MLLQKIIQELRYIPNDRLVDLYRVIHFFRLGVSPQSHLPRSPGLLTGKLGDAFFEPLPEEELRLWE